MKKVISIWNKLLKPRVTSLVLVTVLPGLYLGTDHLSGEVITISLIGTFLMASASFMFNQIIEIERDSKMVRTKNRPLPSGDIQPLTVFITASVFTIASFAILYYYINLLTAIVTLSSLLFYVFIYTIWLKPRTSQNIVIGGIAGCVGPLIGYAATTNSLPIQSWFLFAIIFFWTPPHFWALAIFLKEDYDSASFPMKPITDGIPKTTKEIFYYTIIYTIFCIGFYFIESRMGLLYLIPTTLLCLLMLYYSIRLKMLQTPKLAKQFFFFSIIHLFAVNFLIIADFKS